MSNNVDHNRTQLAITIENAVQIRALNARMLQQEKNNKLLHNDVRKVLTYVYSDPNTKTEGLSEKSNRHDEEIKTLFGHYKGFKIVTVTIASIITTIGGFITWLFSQ